MPNLLLIIALVEKSGSRKESDESVDIITNYQLSYLKQNY